MDSNNNHEYILGAICHHCYNPFKYETHLIPPGLRERGYCHGLQCSRQRGQQVWRLRGGNRPRELRGQKWGQWFKAWGTGRVVGDGDTERLYQHKEQSCYYGNDSGGFFLSLYRLWVQPGTPETILAFQEDSPSPLSLHQLQQVGSMLVTPLLIIGYCRFINICPLDWRTRVFWVKWGCWLIIITLTYAFFLIVKECRHHTFIFKNK